MHTKLSISIVAALALSAAAGGVARADQSQNSSVEASAPSKSPTNEQIDAEETGSPASTDYPKREISKHGATNDEVDAAEQGVPASTDYENRKVPSGGNSNAEWRALDKGVPASTEGDVIEDQAEQGSGK
jgi:hypothetical protein